MDSRTAAERAPSPEAIDFVRFCYRRRRVGWPELYDEMCAVAGRGLFRGWGSDELSSQGIAFSLFELPALAALVERVVAEDVDRRAKPTAAQVRAAHAAGAAATAVAEPPERAVVAPAPEAPEAPAEGTAVPDIRFAAAPATAGA